MATTRVYFLGMALAMITPASSENTFPGYLQNATATSNPACLENWANNPASPSWLPQAIAAVICIVGAILCFLGWRIFNVLVAIVGFLEGFTLTYYLLGVIFEYATVGEAGWVFWTQIGVSLLIGALGAFIAVRFIKVSFFIMGMFLGLAAAVQLNSILAKYIESYPDWALLVLLITLGMLGGVLGVKMGKEFVMASTALSGAQYMMFAVMVWGFGCHAGAESSTEVWVMLGGTFGLGLVGYLVQYRFFKDHENDRYQAVKTTTNTNNRVIDV